jgi:hypothetical protein
MERLSRPMAMDRWESIGERTGGGDLGSGGMACRARRGDRRDVVGGSGGSGSGSLRYQGTESLVLEVVVSGVASFSGTAGDVRSSDRVLSCASVFCCLRIEVCSCRVVAMEVVYEVRTGNVRRIGAGSEMPAKDAKASSSVCRHALHLSNGRAMLVSW